MHFARKEIVMKIERVNENQIRCTLNQADLASRQLKISELAYGSEKAKELFRDMMQQASYEVGFEADDIPLMIEAIPISSDCIVLIITKVENPEELDTRFSKFSPLDDGEYDYDDDYSDIETIDNNSYNDTSVPPTAGDELDADTKTTSEGGIIGDDLMNLFSKVIPKRIQSALEAGILLLTPLLSLRNLPTATEAVLIIILNTKLPLHLFLRQEYILLNLWTILLMLPRSLIIFIMIQAIFTRSQAVTDITLLCRDAAAHL